MTIEYIKEEVEYYTGKKCSDEEAEEILWHVKQGKNLGEVISAYYGC